MLYEMIRALFGAGLAFGMCWVVFMATKTYLDAIDDRDMYHRQWLRAEDEIVELKVHNHNLKMDMKVMERWLNDAS